MASGPRKPGVALLIAVLHRTAQYDVHVGYPIRWAIVFGYGYPILYDAYESTMNTMEYESRVSTNVLGMDRHNLDARQNNKLFRVHFVISFDSLVSSFEKLVLRKLINLNNDVHGSRIFASACSRCIT